ncbi:thioredoxin-disulfide reductase [Nocardia sp. NPDC004415]
MVDDDRVHDVVIVGSGPAGYTAAIYTARAELAPLVFEGTQFGGALMTTTEVENFPGFRTGITGPELMAEMREQAQRFGADLRTEDVEELHLRDPIKTIVAGGVRYRARTVILAMGAAARYLGIPGEQELLGRGVSACATCDGFFFRDHDIAVIGGGDSAMEEAIFLTKFARSVTVVHRSETFRASRIMLDRARHNDKITFLTNTTVERVNGDTTVTSLTIADATTSETRELPVTGVFVAIGHQPRSTLVADQVDLDDNGYVTVAPSSTATSLPGVFAAGDLVDHRYRQAITAAGSGCAAAIDTERWLTHQAADTAAAKRPTVLFVCVRNSGKSQMAAALMRQTAGPDIEVHSAGTDPGSGLNALSVQVLDEVGASTDGEHPKPIDPNLYSGIDLVVVLGAEAKVEAPEGLPVQTWITDEPSERGIDGIDRMRLVRDDIATRITQLTEQIRAGLTVSA